MNAISSNGHATLLNGHLMTEEEFAQELKGSLLILTTSSADKRDIYRLLFSSHAKGEDHYAGLDLYYSDSGALGIAPRKTPEKIGEYSGNLDEKALQQLVTLQDREVQENIRLKLKGEGNEFGYKKINIMGMTEDSGWELLFDDPATKEKFIDIIMREVKPKLREEDYWLLDKLDDTGFPGPNLKPLQEHLEGSFHELMEIIYKAANELHLKDLRFSNTTNVSFVSPRLGKHFKKTIRSTGRLLTRDEYEDRLMGMQRGEAINSNFVQIPDKQKNEGQKTVDMLIRKGLYTSPSSELPADNGRRELTEYLQGLIGKRRSSSSERKRHVKIAFVSPNSIKGVDTELDTGMPKINDLTIVSVPTTAELMKYPDIKNFGDADVIVLIPDNTKYTDNHLRPDPTLGLLLQFAVTADTDPESMGVPIILDNRSAGFDSRLKLWSDAFAQGRLMGDRSFFVANTDKEMREILMHIKDVKQRAPVIGSTCYVETSAAGRPLEKIKRDGIFTVFIGGGHSNNSKRDLEDAKALGYFCAENGWRIITGAGSVEGSMGATHTGFIQYHLDQLQDKSGLDAVKARLEEFKNGSGKYDAERIILENPDFIDELANKGFIPRHMFIGYSMKPLLVQESPSGKEPPAITFHESGNRVRRLNALLASGTKIFLPGGSGTDEEFEETVKQHLEARMRKDSGVANESVFADGTPDDHGTIIIYNRNGRLDKLLAHYGLLGNDPVTHAKRRKHNVKIVSSLEDLKQITKSTAGNWQEKVRMSDSSPSLAIDAHSLP